MTGHPEHGHTKGVDITTAPLGQGLAGAGGMAMAERSMAAIFGPEIMDRRIWVLCRAGCLMEGIAQEAISLAGHPRPDKLTALSDDNGISIGGSTSKAFTEAVPGRFRAAGWHVARCDGHDVNAVDRAIEETRASDCPTLVEMKTEIGIGAPDDAGKASVHGPPFAPEERALARQAYSWVSEAFSVSEDLLAKWRAMGRREEAARQAWEGRLAAFDVDRRAEFERCLAGRLPEGFRAAVAKATADHFAEPQRSATRKASQMALETPTKLCPEMIGGSADLTGSNPTREGRGRRLPDGRCSIRHGVREVNIDADIRLAITGAVRRTLGTDPGDFDPRKCMKPAIAATRKLCVETFEAFGTVGQAAEIGPVPLAATAKRYGAG